MLLLQPHLLLVVRLGPQLVWRVLRFLFLLLWQLLLLLPLLFVLLLPAGNKVRADVRLHCVVGGPFFWGPSFFGGPSGAPRLCKPTEPLQLLLHRQITRVPILLLLPLLLLVLLLLVHNVRAVSRGGMIERRKVDPSSIRGGAPLGAPFG